MILFGIKKQIQELLELFKDFQVTDLIGFGKILDVKETDDFLDYCTQICNQFAQQDKKKRKDLIKLARDIRVANKNMVSKKGSERELEKGGDG